MKKSPVLSRPFCIILLLCIVALAACQRSATQSPAPPAMFRGGPERTGVFDTPNVTHLTGLKWKFATGGPVWSSPVVAGGILYVGSDDANVYAIDVATGKEKWHAATGKQVRSSPAVANGRVFIQSDDGFFYALEAATGRQIWKFASSAGPVRPSTTSLSNDYYNSSPVVSGDLVYVGSQDNTHGLYAVDVRTGQKRWSHDVEGSSIVRSSPAVADGVVYYGGIDAIYALDAATGKEKWFNYWSNDLRYPVAVGGGLLFYGTKGGSLFALDAADGTEKWRIILTGDSWVTGGPAIGQGMVYAGTSDGRSLYAVSIDSGEQLWVFTSQGCLWSSPALDRGVLYVGSGDNNVYAVDAATGKELWHYLTGGVVYSSPFISDGSVYVGSLDGNVYALN
jgi:eukaryotic-like serine/threonine-protein kinase